MGSISVDGFCIGPVQTNTYIVYREPEAVAVIDPADEGDKLYDYLEGEGFHVEAILLTHGHFDHILGIDGILSRKKVPVVAPAAEKKLLGDASFNQSVVLERPCTIEPDVWLEDGDEYTAAGVVFRMIHTPGHTEGSSCYLIEDEERKILFSGDTLFQASVGRTDLPTGSRKELNASVEKLYQMLPDDTVVYPGHGEATYIGYEKKYNPFVKMKE